MAQEDIDDPVKKIFGKTAKEIFAEPLRPTADEPVKYISSTDLDPETYYMYEHMEEIEDDYWRQLRMLNIDDRLLVLMRLGVTSAGTTKDFVIRQPLWAVKRSEFKHEYRKVLSQRKAKE